MTLYYVSCPPKTSVSHGTKSHLLKDLIYSTSSSQLQVFSFGVAGLQLFVEANWLGNKERDVIEGTDIKEIEKSLILDGGAFCLMWKAYTTY